MSSGARLLRFQSRLYVALGDKVNLSLSHFSHLLNGNSST